MREILFILFVATAFLTIASRSAKQEQHGFIRENIEFAVEQYGLQTAIIEE